MNGKHHKLVMALLVSMAATEARAQDAIVDQLTVPFSDPARPGTIRVALLNGSIRVVGYEGKDVQLTARVRSDGSEVENDHDDDSQRAKSAGMRRLHNTSTGLAVEEDDNIMEVQVEGMNRTVDVTLKVPHRISLELNTTNDGDINVDGVEGEFEVNSTNGVHHADERFWIGRRPRLERGLGGSLPEGRSEEIDVLQFHERRHRRHPASGGEGRCAHQIRQR